MGRKKLDMQFISNEKKRLKAFDTRMKGLVKKLYEFTTLCAADAVMLVYGTNGNAHFWPANNPLKVRQLVDVYEKSKTNNEVVQHYNGMNYYKGKKADVEKEIVKLRKQKLDARYPMDILKSLNSGKDCASFHAMLGKKAEDVRNLIQHMKVMNAETCYQNASSSENPLAISMYHQDPSFDQYQQLKLLNQNNNLSASMMGFMNNNDNYYYEGDHDIYSQHNEYLNSNQEGLCDDSAWDVLPTAICYEPEMPLVHPPYLEYNTMPEMLNNKQSQIYMRDNFGHSDGGGMSLAQSQLDMRGNFGNADGGLLSNTQSQFYTNDKFYNHSGVQENVGNDGGAYRCYDEELRKFLGMN